jgi:hypothetical protein
MKKSYVISMHKEQEERRATSWAGKVSTRLTHQEIRLIHRYTVRSC